MRTIVVTGGTSGIGKAVASTYLDRGDQVVVVGPDPAKGKRFLDEGGDRAVFIRADLSLVSENRRVIDEIAARFATVDALVLCARYFRSFRTVTAEGFEHNFALYYLSRFLLGYVLLFPSGTRTGLAGEFDAPTAAHVAEMKRHGQPVERVIPRSPRSSTPRPGNR